MTTAENTHRILITVKGGVVYVESGTVPFCYELRNIDSGDAPFSQAEIDQQSNNAKSIAAAQGVVSTLVAALRDSKAALASAAHQIDQMKGMFDDADGTIADALEDADDAHDKAEEAIALAGAQTHRRTDAQTHGMVTLSADQYRRILERLKANAELISDAIDTHIYDDGDEIDEDNCQYHIGRRKTEELIESLPEAT